MEMALQSLGEERKTGGGLSCPSCGCRDMRTYGTIPGHASTFRYKQCRHCGGKVYTVQEPEKIIRSVGETKD